LQLTAFQLLGPLKTTFITLGDHEFFNILSSFMRKIYKVSISL